MGDQKARVQIGKRFKEARQKKNLSQVEVANKVDLHFNYYARIERGDANPSLDVLLKISKVLGVNL